MLKKILLIALLALALPVQADQVADQMECSQFWDTVTLGAVNGARTDITLSGGFYGGCVIVPEASVSGATWVTVPIKKNNSGPNVYSLTSANTAVNWSWTFRNTGEMYNMFRLRNSSIGSPGSRLVTLTTNP